MAYAESPKGLSKWQQFVRSAKGFGTFLYDKEKGEVMGRNASSWGKITVFFIIFYLCLAAFFAGMLNAFLATMPEIKDGPKLTQYLAGKSALRVTPSHKIRGFEKTNKDSYDGFTELITKLFDAYNKSSNFAPDFCNFTSTDSRPSDAKKQCKFDLSKLGPCSNSANSYGYEDGSPCFYMQMNKVFNWIPEPDDGLSYIRVECTGGKVYPEDTPGFPVSFFPFRGGDWLSPIVAVQINGTSKEQIKCSAFGKNVERSSTYLIERGAFNRVRITIG